MSTSLTALLRAKQQELKNKSGREKTVAPPAGASRWRILPHWGDDPNALFSHDFGQHFIKDFSGEVKSVYICTLRTFNKPCAICETMAKSVAGMEDENAKKLVSEARAQQRYLMNAVRKTDKGYEQDVCILSLPNVCFEALVTAAAQYAEGDNIDIFDPTEGYDVIISREGTGPKNTKYTVMVAPKPSAISPEYLKKRRNLDEYCAQEYEQGQTAALAALTSVAGASTPSLAVLPPATSTPSIAGTAAVKAVAGKVTAITPSASEVAAALEVDLNDVDLEGLEEIE